MAKGDRGGKGGSAGGSKMTEAERKARLQRFLELDSKQNADGDEVVTTRGRASSTQRSLEVPTNASSLKDATEKADNYVRRMDVGDEVKVGPYTYTKMNGNRFSYKETGGGYRIISEAGVSDAIVDHMRYPASARDRSPRKAKAYDALDNARANLMSIQMNPASTTAQILKAKEEVRKRQKAYDALKWK